MTDEPDDAVHDDLAALYPESGWPELRARVGLTGAMHLVDPSRWPLVKIGEFDAIVCIGEGGWGIVFKARDPKLGRLVALKLCRTRTPELIEAIKKEAQALAELDHPNIVPVYELGEHEGAPFFVMPYMAGRNAADFARREPGPTWRQTVRLYCGAARGLAAAHRRGIVHGDVKPQNFLLDLDDVARIADFGLARRVIEDADASEQEGLLHRAGTIYYAAPEVLRGERGDARSDQFSFFVALAQTLEGGALPFKGESSGELLENIQRTEVQFTDPTIPRALIALVRIGLSEDPSERLPDMDVVAAELERVLLESPPDESVLEPAASADPPPEEPPDFEPAPASESPPAEPEPEPPELLPLGSGPAPSKAKRGAVSVSLVLAVGLTLGWLGRARVESPRPSDDPVPLPSSPCALGDEQGVSVEIDPVVLAVCTYIRRGQIEDADKTWNSVYRARWAEIESLTARDPAEAADKLAADTMIIVQTYQQWAKLSAGPDVAKAPDLALRWTPDAEKAWSEAKKIREKKSRRAKQPAPK